MDTNPFLKDLMLSEAEYELLKLQSALWDFIVSQPMRFMGTPQADNDAFLTHVLTGLNMPDIHPTLTTFFDKDSHPILKPLLTNIVERKQNLKLQYDLAEEGEIAINRPVYPDQPEKAQPDSPKLGGFMDQVIEAIKEGNKPTSTIKLPSVEAGVLSLTSIGRLKEAVTALNESIKDYKAKEEKEKEETKEEQTDLNERIDQMLNFDRIQMVVDRSYSQGDLPAYFQLFYPTPQRVQDAYDLLVELNNGYKQDQQAQPDPDQDQEPETYEGDIKLSLIVGIPDHLPRKNEVEMWLSKALKQETEKVLIQLNQAFPEIDFGLDMETDTNKETANCHKSPSSVLNGGSGLTPTP